MPYRSAEQRLLAKQRYYAKKGRASRRRAYLAQRLEREGKILVVNAIPLIEAIANWRH